MTLVDALKRGHANYNSHVKVYSNERPGVHVNWGVVTALLIISGIIFCLYIGKQVKEEIKLE